MKNSVNTVLGEYDIKQLDFVLMHEHCYLGSWNNRIADPNYYNFDDGMKMIAGVLSDAKSHGVRTLIDYTTFNMGRDIQILKEVSKISGVNIIAASGCMMDVGNWAQRISVETLTKFILDEITIGVQGTEIKCGVIKCGIENQIDKVTMKMLKACARAQFITGVPIITHCRPEGQEFGLKQIEIYKSENVDLSKVVIGHFRNGDSLEYAKKIVESGANFAIDQMNFNAHQFEYNINLIPQLIELGYIEHLFLSHDVVIVYNHSPWKDFDHRTYINYAEDSLSYINRKIIPELLKRGVTEDQIEQIFVKNPKRLFEKSEIYDE